MDNYLHVAEHPEAAAAASEAGVQFGASDAFLSAMSNGNHVQHTTPSLTEAILDPDLFLVSISVKSYFYNLP